MPSILSRRHTTTTTTPSTVSVRLKCFWFVLLMAPLLQYRKINTNNSNLAFVRATVHHKWKVMGSAFRSLQEVMLRTSLDRAQLNYGIIFECRSTSNLNYDSDVHFSLQLGDMGGFRRLDPTKKLALFLHGWNDQGSKDWVQDMLRTWTHYQERYTVCVVDWGHLSTLNYKTASMSIFDVGVTVAGIIMALEELRPNYFTRRNVTIAGYSLGAHAAGYAGAVLNGEIEEIIGLDPAGPLFTMPSIVSAKYRLDKSDARYVQVLHTSSGMLGTSIKSGHADYYPNGGKAPQRHCVFTSMTMSDISNTNPVSCSHSAAAQYFKQAMNPSYPFIGFHCHSYENFAKGLCFNNHRGRFGIHSERRVSGNFYFNTLSSSPYVRRSQFFNSRASTRSVGMPVNHTKKSRSRQKNYLLLGRWRAFILV